MTIRIRQIHPVFVGEVDGVDLRRPLAADGGRGDRGRHGSLRRAGVPRPAAHRRAADGVQPQLRRDRARAWQQHHQAARTGGCRSSSPTSPTSTRRPGRSRATTAGACSTSATGSGTRTARSAPIPAKYSLLSARAVPSRGGNTEFADMRAAYDALDDETKAEVEDLVCEHSLIYSRGLLGFADFTEEEKATFAPVRQRLVRTHPVTGRKSLYPLLARRRDRRLADARGARLPARPDRARDPARSSSTPTSGGSTTS